MSMTTTSTVRLAAAGTALLAAAAVGSVVTASGAHADPTRHATSISIRALHHRVHAGATDTITGDLHISGVADRGGRQVTLAARTPGQDDFTPIGVDTTGPRGALHLSVQPEVTTRYKWEYAGATDAKPRNSGTVTVRISTSHRRAQRLPTNLSVRAEHRLISPKGGDTIRSVLRSRHTELPHRLVVLQSHPAAGHDQPESSTSRWHFVAAHRTGPDGRVAFHVTASEATVYRTRFLGTTVFRPSRSGTVRVGIRAPRTSVTISATPATIDPGQQTAISGVATDQGQDVVGATADLLAKPSHGQHAFQQVADAITGPDGAVGFTQAPTTDTTYRIRVERSAEAPAGLSPSQVVRVRDASSLSIRGRHTGHGYVVTGTLRGHGHPIAHVRVTLMARAPSGTTWTDVADQHSGRRGGVRFTRTEAAGTAYRLSFAGSMGFASTTSGTVVD